MMKSLKQQNQGKAEEEVFLTHVFNAPRELVFVAWTDPQQLLNWFAPGDCTIIYKKIDVRTGGFYHSCVQDPVHGDCWCKGTYLEVTYPERIVCTMEITDGEGNDIDPTASNKEGNWPQKTVLTVNFMEEDGKTRLTLHQTVSAALAQRSGALPSWHAMLKKLDTQLGLRLNKS